MIIPIKPWLDSVAETGEESGFGRTTGLPGGLILPSDAEAEELMRPAGRRGAFHFATMTSDRMDFYHAPIMAGEILDAMRPVEGKQIFDGTLGGGGHAEALLEHGAHVIGCDQDGEALAHAGRRLEHFGDRFLPMRGNFAAMDELLHGQGIDVVDGVLLDLGVSSRQFDDAERGFSFREDGPLDMRMDDRADLSAREVINEWPEAELIRIFREYGEEKRAVRAAREIVRARAEAPIETTAGLAAVVAKAIPKTSGKHPATRVFQAVRIAVNRELEVLETALEKSVGMLSVGGVMAIISFHSLEDRIVKRFMRRRSNPFIDRPEWPEPKENPDYCLSLPSRRVTTPGEREVESNPRARSAKLRVAVKL